MLRNLTVLAAGFVALLYVSAAPASEVRITVNDRSTGGRCGEGVVLLAVPEEGDSTTVDVPLGPHHGPTVITLDDARPWRVSARKDRCWSSTATWISSFGNHLTLDLFSSATLHGKFAAADLPSLLKASVFRIVADQSSAARWAAAEPLDCSVDPPKWQCAVPADLPMDVRLEPHGFAPVYLWDAAMQPGKSRDTGTQKLIEGASLAGWVEDPDAAPLAGATVTLSPLQPEHPEAGRVVAAQHRATSNPRGFFQLTGIPPGDYRLVSRASSPLSPVVVPALTVRPSTAVTWPSPLRHAPPLTLNVAIDPVKATDGSPWRVVVTELVSLIPGSQPVSVPLLADDHGLWSAAGLRTDRYELVIRDGADSVVERREIDLSAGAPATLNVSIHSIAVTGVVKVADEPLAAADLRFTSSRGKGISVTTDADGRFAALFPSVGRWNLLVYPYGRQRRAEIRATPVEVSADADLEIVLPGGRIRGAVVTSAGTPVKAAVHIVRDGDLVGQQMTSDDGRFDFIGLTAATYELSAEADEGAAPALEARLAKDQTSDFKIVVEPYRVVRGTVLTPGGQPASGAIVRSSTDGGWSWSDLVAGVRGDFEYFLPPGVRDLELVVLSYSYPTAMMRIAVGNTTQRPLSINLLPAGGSLRVDPDRAFIIRQDVVVPLNMFYLPRSLGVTSGAHLEPGSYTICLQQRVDDDCQRVLIAPGTSSAVSFRSEKAKENAR